MKKIRRTIAFLLAMLILVQFAGCNKQNDVTAEKKVSETLNAFKNLQMETINKYVDIKKTCADNGVTVSDQDIENILKATFSRLQYKIISTEREGNTVKVKTEITMTDMRSVINAFIKDAISMTMKNALNGDHKQSDEQMQKVMILTLQDIIKNKNQKTITKTVDIPVVKQGNTLVVQMDEHVLDAILGGAVSTLYSIGKDLKTSSQK